MTKGGLTVEARGYRIPLAVTISRKTGKATRIQWRENGTRDEFLNVFEWMKDAGQAAIRSANGSQGEETQQ